MTLTSERAAELGRLSAQARRERPTFPELDSPANAKVRLAIISNLALKGAITPQVAHVEERLHRTWLEAWAVEQGVKRVRALELRIRELEDELAQTRARSGVRRGVA